jgi:hypothetical protein
MQVLGALADLFVDGARNRDFDGALARKSLEIPVTDAAPLGVEAQPPDAIERLQLPGRSLERVQHARPSIAEL